MRLLCACVGLVLRHQPGALAESLPELLAFCIQVIEGLGGGWCCVSACMRRRSAAKAACCLVRIAACR